MLSAGARQALVGSARAPEGHNVNTTRLIVNPVANVHIPQRPFVLGGSAFEMRELRVAVAVR